MAMDIKNAVLARLADHVPGQVDTSNIDPSSTFKEMGLDSLAVIEMIFELEERLSIIIEESELRHVETVADLICVVEKTQKNVISHPS